MLKLLTSSIVAYKAYDYLSIKESKSSESQNVERNAICIMFPDNNSGVKGLVSFHQQSYDSETYIVANIKGLSPNSLHGFHIHEYGDLTDGCTTAGGHFNPNKKNHGSPQDDERHVGDLGNLKTNEYGHGYMAITDSLISLFGEHSIIGRACVVHEQTDDLGRGNDQESKITGNAGKRLACGIIGLSKDFKSLAPPTPDTN